ncbi:MAG: hemerythrin [Deltaproteobacteria bacterium]|nr:hemerythrin [Deltaproteobacteria bacterium]
MKWSSKYVLNVQKMDTTHREFAERVTEIEKASVEDLAEALDKLIAHTVEHFEAENQWMLETKFPAYSEHYGEHQRVLLLLNVIRRVVLRTPEVVYDLAHDLSGWFDMHLATMDSALAAHIKAENSSKRNCMP